MTGVGPPAYHRLYAAHHIVLVYKEVGTVEECGHSTAEQQRTNYAVDNEKPLERARAEQIAQFVLELVAHRLKYKREQDNHPQPVGSAETCTVEQWERGEKSTSEGYESGERQFPFASCRVDEHAALFGSTSDRENHGIASLDEEHEHEQGSKQRNEEPPILLQKFVCHICRLLI